MRLSDMTTDQLADALLNMAEPLANIGQDDAVIEGLKRVGDSVKAGTPTLKIVGDFAATVVPIALRDHRTDIYAIVAYMQGKSIDDISSQNGLQTIKDIRSIIDNDLVDFFMSALGTEPAASSQPSPEPHEPSE